MMRTPLGQVRGLGSAKKGTGEFIVQRLTSIALVFLMLAFIVIVVSLNGEPYETVVATLSSPLVAIILIAGILATVVHMRIGMQVIIEDYIYGELAKATLLTLNWLFSWGVGLVALFAVMKLALGGA
ncbi:MAG: succinate dehydrogenase, hydrophobic membrane anchor protein [Propylenella sp.]